ncbi:HupE/UreJ family protein [Myxococcota bacterium]|nr:HupE/UreJ family protein [Myxococcota bacterium]MCZ7618213.1 HupE/UreJ family protein [Myxococcota bacterium]
MTIVLRAVAGALALGMGMGLAGTPVPVFAHPLAPALLDVIERTDAGAAGHFAVRWRAEATSAATPRFPRHCRETDPGKLRVDAALGYVERSWEVDCEGRGLEGATLAVDGLATDRRDALIRVQGRDGRVVQKLLRAGAPAWRVPAQPRRAALLADHVRLGIAHLAAGPDHWLFLLGLLALGGGRRAILLAVSAFTAGHAATLSLATLGIVQVPSRPVEIAIAASLVVLAWELAERHRAERRGDFGRRPSRLVRRPARLAFGFGLVHGLGFAGALAELGLPSGEIPLALLGFNLGIEIGQLVGVMAWAMAHAIAARLPLVGGSTPLLRALRVLPAHALGALGIYWVLDRIL